MVVVNRAKCGYCGSCVSLCPVGAINLAETRLQIDERCVECGLCIDACPVGAISPEADQPEAQALPRSRYDVVVVGAGPAGSTVARVAAEHGLSVLLLEKRQEIGSPVRCAEGVGHVPLAEFIAPDPAWISAEIKGAYYCASQDGHTEEVRFDGDEQVGYVLERRVFDRVLAEKAVAAGASVWVKTPVSGLLCDDNRVAGVLVEVRGNLQEIDCSVVVGADGVESWVGRWAGLETCLAPRDSMPCAQYLLSGIDVDPCCMQYYVGNDIAPGGYAWVFPKGDGRANVGLGVQSDLAAAPAFEYLQRFIDSQPFLAQGSPVTLILGNAPTAIPAAPLVTDGCLLVGDAARQLDPLTGGGILNAMAAGKIAGEVIAAAIAARDVSAARLRPYEERWQAGLGKRMARNYRIKERFGADQRASRDFMRLFVAATGAK
jgi:digeranylgeranylglycerophospholipid reductase